jgi:hypothetical protein
LISAKAQRRFRRWAFLFEIKHFLAAMLHLGGELTDGVLPESLSAEFLAKAIAVRDPSADTVKAYGIAFYSAFHQHDDRRIWMLLRQPQRGERWRALPEYARQVSSRCVASLYAMPSLREALMSDAAVFQARRRKRADLAGPKPPVFPASH